LAVISLKIGDLPTAEKNAAEAVKVGKNQFWQPDNYMA
jgi:hypothetical protein